MAKKIKKKPAKPVRQGGKPSLLNQIEALEALLKQREAQYEEMENKYWMARRDSEAVRSTLKVVEENIYTMMEPLESHGECSLCHADLMEADRMESAAVAHSKADAEGEGACPIGDIRRALLRREREDQILLQFGRRNHGRDMGMIIDAPPELGYRCPLGHWYLDFSEFNDHIWCNDCERDYHYARECVLVEDKYNPKGLPEQPRVITGISNWTPDGNGFMLVPSELLKPLDK